MKQSGLHGQDLGQPDHVRDIQFGGPDSFSNLWPLLSSTNQEAGLLNARQAVTYCETEDSEPKVGQVSQLPGRFFKIRDWK
jgi:hypothetical protein